METKIIMRNQIRIMAWENVQTRYKECRDGTGAKGRKANEKRSWRGRKNTGQIREMQTRCEETRRVRGSAEDCWIKKFNFYLFESSLSGEQSTRGGWWDFSVLRLCSNSFSFVVCNNGYQAKPLCALTHTQSDTELTHDIIKWHGRTPTQCPN